MSDIGNYEAVKIEEEILDFWEKNQIYQKAKQKVSKGKDFYFLDGPPYTSGSIHIGTAWNKALKDCFIRYKRLRGFNIYDRAGYDMHGLPTENATQKKLGLKTKEEIQAYGIAKFIEECKKLCVTNLKKMSKDFQRLGVWMDFDNAYQTIKKEFIDGEWWLIKQAHEKKRLYRGLRTMTWCPITESALAKHELEYKTIKDDSIFMKFKVKNKENEFLIIWTTTPWTIPFNLGVMVNPEVEYVRAKVGDEVWIIAAPLVAVLVQGVVDKKYEVLEKLKGDKLEGLEYEHPLYNDLKEVYDEIKSGSPKTHTIVLSTEYVDTSSGSGLVHMAPGCGPEDYEIGYRNNIPPFNNIDERGVFPENMGPFAGMTARKDDARFTEMFEDRKCLIGKTEVEHDYPHDWRYHNPVIFRTTKQWFFKVEDLKERMVEENKKIKWVPKSAFNAFDSWLKNLRDNSVSKQRYWGTPLPIWMNVDDEDDYIVIGSSKELEQLTGKKFDDLHISSLDDVEIKKDGQLYRRVPDVLDVWVDAGTVSWNALDYPQKNELFEKLFPADFILEGKDQIRGWYNLLLIASMLALDKPSFKSVYMHGFTNDALGRKMSKSAGNMISPEEVTEKYGADVFRYYSIGGANPGIDLNYNFDDMRVKHKHLGVLWNIHKFLIDYAKELKLNPKEITIKEGELSIEEVYILSKLNSTIKHVTKLFEEFKINEVPLKTEELLLELSRTYMQLVREKSSLGNEEDKKIVLYTIYRVLYDCLRLLNPVIPMTTEKIYQNLKKAFDLDNESVHLCGWPEFHDDRIDYELENNFDHAKSVIQSILFAREKASLGVRWPVKEAIILTKDDHAKKAITELKDIIKTQTNVKDLDVVDKFDKVKENIKTDYAKLGPDYGDLTPKIIAHLAAESPNAVLQHIEKNGKYDFKIYDKKGTKEVSIVKEHIIVERSVEKPYIEAVFRSGRAYLNTELTRELESEGFARELMRRVQSLRKKQGLKKSDTIELFLKTDEDMINLFKYHEKLICEKVGAKNITFSELDIDAKFEAESAEKVKGKEFKIMFNKL